MNNIAFQLGLRNVLRNKRRTFITAGVIGIGLMSITLTDGFIDGFLNYMISASTSDFSGQTRVHHVKYDENNQSKYYIKNPKPITKKFTEDKDVKNFTKRTMSTAMIASAENNLNIMLFGIEPTNEAKFSKLKSRISDGGFLDNPDKEDILIGDKLAKRLNLSVGKKVVVTVSQSDNGELEQSLFRVKGIFSYRNRQMDEGIAFIPLKLSQKLLNIGNGVHEIAINYKELSMVEPKGIQYKNSFDEYDAKFETWHDFMPVLQTTIEMSSQSIGITSLILGLLVAFSIANTLYMSLFERVFEIGVIKAIGTRKNSILSMILVEAAGIGFFGIAFGLILTGLLGGYLAYYGVNYSEMSYAGVSFRDPIYFVFNTNQFTLYPFITLIFVIFVSIFPARQILKKNTAESLKQGK